MTRISGNLLVQRVDDLLVIMDESAGEEVAVPIHLVAPVVKAIIQLFPEGPKAERATEPDDGEWDLMEGR